MRLFYASLWILLICFLVLICSCAAKADDSIGISTDPVGMSYYTLGMQLKSACPQLPINIITSNGGVSNLANLFTSNDVQFACVAYDTMWMRDRTDPDKMKKVRVVMPLNYNTIHLIVNVNSGIKDLMDLAGRRVNKGPVGSGTNVTSTIIMLKTGLKFTESTYSQADAIKKLMAGQLDAIFYASAIPADALTAIGKDGDGVIKMVTLSHPALNNFYTQVDIPANVYPWQSSSVGTLAVKNLLVTYNYQTALRQQQVADLTQCIVDKLPELQDNAIWREVEPGSYSKVKWEMHSRAKQVIDNKR
jgi:TRAP transporter TAXI family solute receptor